MHRRKFFHLVTPLFSLSLSPIYIQKEEEEEEGGPKVDTISSRGTYIFYRFPESWTKYNKKRWGRRRRRGNKDRILYAGKGIKNKVSFAPLYQLRTLAYQRLFTLVKILRREESYLAPQRSPQNYEILPAAEKETFLIPAMCTHEKLVSNSRRRVGYCNSLSLSLNLSRDLRLQRD